MKFLATIKRDKIVEATRKRRNFSMTLLAIVLFVCAPLSSWAVDREDPLVAFNFGLEVEGKLAGLFTSVEGIGSESEVVEHEITNPDTGETIIQKRPGRLTWLDVTLIRGITSDQTIWEWRKQVEDGDVDGARSNISIIVYNQANEEIARWNFENAWPIKISAPEPPVVSASSYMVESFTITHEGYERVD